MSYPASDEAVRASGRFVRNLALSLSGGALLALVGASAAHAQDASTDSSGLGATGTGDATALGNHSGSNTTQGGTISGAQGSVQVITQSGGIDNHGVAVANTGGNQVRGNTSHNTATAEQDGVGGSGAAINDGQAANGSDGVAFITTGNASAIGNQSTTNLNQTISARGALGGILVLTQDSTVTNSGRAFAGTGDNTAIGNSSRNSADLMSTFNLANGLGANSGKATNDSQGKATIATGNASAMGNVSDTSVTQSSNGAAGGDGMGGGLVVIPQVAEVTNEGRARATTGDNQATGNKSENGTDIFQSIGSATPAVPFFQTGTGVASNTADGSSWSDGTARIRTGDASAVGNQSSTGISQWATSDLTTEGGLSLLPQASTVDNDGRARARTGDNQAFGNGSDNEGGPDGAAVAQHMPGDLFTVPVPTGFLNSGVASNQADASNRSDGQATIATGAAKAAGNRSTTHVSQSSTANASDLNIYPQVAIVSNTGRALARTGGNRDDGNDTSNDEFVDQANALPTTPGLDHGVIDNSARASSSTDGTASITTGAASAVGNDSTTSISQEIDPVGLVLPVQAAAVVNAGAAVAQTGGNMAEGNGTGSLTELDQVANPFGNSTPPPVVTAGLVVAANQADAADASDGSASITTGSATATGNQSGTSIEQRSTGTVDGLGLIVNTQAAAVVNLGAAVASTGGNTADGNETSNQIHPFPDTYQDAELGNDDAAASSFTTGIATVSNSGSADNSSDGTADITTGSARAAGNRAQTRVTQDEAATVSGIGAVINTQAAIVANAGLGVASTGGNTATGNRSSNIASLVQDSGIGGDDPAGATVLAGSLTAANSGSVSNSSDGTAGIATGSADALGNASSTDVSQDPGSTISGLGLVVNTQVAAVANLGVGAANTGGNDATGNRSVNEGRGGNPGALLTQIVEVGNGNSGATSITAIGPVLAADQGEVRNTSDGTARVRTGSASAQGNVSTTTIDQAEVGAVSGLGVALDTQAAGVANIGVGVADSGDNEAIGNEADNSGGGGAPVPGAQLVQNAPIGSVDTGAPTITSVGPMVANNSGTASNTSDGTAQVGTGSATASGNQSSTTIRQHQAAAVTDLGLIVNTQVAGVANIGIGVANSGHNEAIGDAAGAISPTGGTPVANTATATQSANFVSNTGTPTTPVTVVGPLTATNQGEASNDSDGNACVCTGNATASGNISTTTLSQDLDTSVGTGVAVLTEAGGVLNAGVGIANSGLNLAEGNISQNLATDFPQEANINAGLAGAPGGIVGPQTAQTAGGATNDSHGTGKVGTGNARATGNESTTGFTQAATSDSDLAISTLAAGTTNTGLGLANSGVNLGVGNASVNEAHLAQTADGAGIVSSVGTASNESDGSGLVGNPSCNVPGAPTTPGTPGMATLPHTGAPIEVEAAVGLMLLLAGFGLRRKSQQLA